MKFSIIIPSKNNPEQVRRCIDSIPSNEDIEILVCDDHSDVHSLALIHKVTESKSNAKVIESDNSGWAGKARNVGIDNSHGEWLIFSDSDDFFNLEFWNHLYNDIQSTTSDILYYYVQGVYSETLEPADRGWNYKKLVEDFLNHKKNSEERLRYFHMVPWGKVFKKSFIIENNIRYDEVRASNDVMFNIVAGSLAKKVEAHDTLMYYVTVSNNSLTKKKDKELLRCRFDVLLRHYKYVMSLGKPQCAYNMIRYAIRYSKPYGLREFFHYVKLMIKNRVNPFISFYKIGRYD